MSNHKTKVVGKTGGWQAKCTCIGPDSPVYERRWEADDWLRAHLRVVEQARIHLRDRLPSLKDQRDWFRKQAAQAADEATRAQWLRLAEELDHRLGTVPLHDDALF